ncbi:MAG TPA: PEP-CTERM sorting domain-containing protein [Pirellulales bacterium]|jgi:probable HAF family extracellular repeat protein
MKSRVAFLAVALANSAISLAADYTVTDLGTLGGSASSARAISDSGLVTGAITIGNQSHVFLYDGTMHDIGTGVGDGVNDAGMVTGTTPGASPDDSSRVFLYDGTMHDLGPGASYGINNSGEIVLDGILGQGFLYYGGSMHPMPLLPGGINYAIPLAINNSGEAAGVGDAPLGYNPGAELYAFLYDGTTMHDIGTHGQTPDAVLFTSIAYGLNGHGDVVGTDTALSTGGAGISGGFLNIGGVENAIPGIAPTGVNNSDIVVGTSTTGAAIYTLGGGLVNLDALIAPSSGWHITAAAAINDAGQIVGSGSFDGGPLHAVLLNPVPEPSTIALAGFGALAMMLIRWIGRQGHCTSR